MTLRLVPDDTDTTPIPYADAQAEFQQHWRAVKAAHGELISAAGDIAVPLLVLTGPVTRHRIEDVQRRAQAIASHVQALTEHLAACREIFARAEHPTTPPTTAPITTTKEQS